ncbi:probable phospholipid-transporting ATPase IM isoform X2 [Symsagittifera roscoffensis]|uniref:probable phospholipid-transporting ATPase IM isoform X2 n=1 Tax=Symsagittifera roscoffensis TaxID=84072 RepID=UPI00307BF762
MKPWWRNKETEENRTLYINDIDANKRKKFARNVIKTTKYNAFTFLPINLFEQFKRVANVYFLILLIMQLLPINLSSISAVTTIVPLVVVLAVTAVKDAIDDIRRKRNDSKVNNRSTTLVEGGVTQSVKWKKVKVGDIIKLENDEFVPADMMILSSSEPHAVCFIETAELDGETNLKMRQGLKETEHVTDTHMLNKIQGKIVCEKPNNNLNDFQGELHLQLPSRDHADVLQLTNNNILLRGCRMRNTPWVCGVVVFSGKETKLVQNSGKVAFKRTHLDKLLNILVLTIFAFLFLLCLIASGCAALWEQNVGQSSGAYLAPVVIMDRVYNVHPAAYMGLSFIAYVILLNTVVPISLYVTVEVIRLGLSLFIDWDQKMWYYEAGSTASSGGPRKAKARTTTLNEELGQVKYVFSDKTGTLTQNKMVFKMCSVGGSVFGQSPHLQQSDTEFTKVEYIDDESRLTSSVGTSTNQSQLSSLCLPEHRFQQKSEDTDFRWRDRSLASKIESEDEVVKEFFTSLALCHTVLPEADTDSDQKIIPGSLKYQAQSPDEAALLTAARAFGFTFTARTPEEMEVCVKDEVEFYQLLAFVDFNNDRKRMSVVVRGPFKPDEDVEKEQKNKAITLYCKGADNLIFDRLAPGQQFLKDLTDKHLEMFASEGLRTLVVAKKPIEHKFLEDWLKRYDRANKSPYNDDAIEELEEELEGGMVLLGATAIEDKLQDHVAETIEAIHQAHIKLWVLTGDKLETAMNIGYSCKMLQNEDEMEVCVIDSDDPSVITEELLRIEQLLLDRDRQETMLHDNTDRGHKDPNAVSRIQRGASEDGGGEGGGGVSSQDLGGGSNKNRAYAVIITGAALMVIEQLSEKKGKKHATDNWEHKATLKEVFLDVGCKCHTVICSRVTPGQKALIVEWVKERENAITLSIGDGANDVSMIKKAHIGVGVEGNEGMQAVLNSDYSIAQFHYLKRLLLLHGHWSYHRMSFFLRYFFYKNFAFSLLQFWFAMYCGFSAQSVYDGVFITLYNMLYTALPVIAIGLFDKDVGSKYCMTFPQIYCVGQEDKLFNKFVFFQSVLHGTWHSIVVFFVTVGLYSNYTDSAGLDHSDYYSFIAAIQSNLVLVVNLQAILDTKNWTVVNNVFIWGSVASFFIVQLICGLPQFADSFIYDWFGQSGSLLAVLLTANYWFTALLTVALCILPVVALRTVEIDLRPSYIDLMRIISKKKRAITRQSGISDRRSARPVSRRRRTSSYAFSHSEGFGKMVSKGSYLEDPKEYDSSRVHIGSRGRSASRVLPTHQAIDEDESFEMSGGQNQKPKRESREQSQNSSESRSRNKSEDERGDELGQPKTRDKSAENSRRKTSRERRRSSSSESAVRTLEDKN